MENDEIHYHRGGQPGASQDALGVGALISSSAEWREGELRATPTRGSREGELRTPPRHLTIPGHQRTDSSASEVSLDEGRDLLLRDEGDLSMGIASSSSSGSSLENQLVTGSTMKKEFKIKVSPMRMHHYGSDSDLGERPLVCEICDTQVGLDLDGNEFVPCECAFPICRKCYEYIREHDGGNCPQCKERYKRMQGSPLMPWDAEDEAASEEEDEDGFQQTPLLPRYGGSPLEGPPSVKLLKNESPGGVHSSQVIVRVNAEDIQDPDELEKNYGMGSIVWTPALQRINSPGDEYVKVLGDEKFKALSRKVPINWKLLNPYRALVVVRFAVMFIFLFWRVTTPNHKAYWLWLTSVICEIWFAVSWLFDQAQKWSPVTRETYLDRLELKYGKEGETSELAAVDVFVSTADPEKEPPLVTANVILSVLAADYPTDKIACYLSDDGGALLTYEALHETSCFARHWVPFCKKFEIEPRAPEMYFGEKGDYLKGQIKQEFVKERRSMKRLYEEFKVRINALVAKAQNRPRDGWTMADGSPWPGNKRADHESMIQVLLQPDGNSADVQMNKLPWLVYVSREKRPKHNHNKKAGAMNSLVRASGVITNAPYILNLDCDHYVNYAKAFKVAMCFMMDPVKGPGICYVQFPQRFDGIDTNDRYSNHNTVFYDINMKGLDSIQGPVYVGTGCCFRRQAIYGYEPPAKARDALRDEEKRTGFFSFCCGPRKRKEGKKGKKGAEDDVVTGQELSEMQDLKPQKETYEDLKKRFGQCEDFVNSTLETGVSSADFSEPDRVLRDAIEVTAIDYEKGSLWGKDIGWIYGSITEDIVTGFVMHSRGWRSVYAMTPRPAFKGTAPINMADRLHQVLRWGLGSVEIFFSRHNPMWYGYRKGNRGLKGGQRLAYINTTVYPFTSIPLVVYCILPALCLFFNQFVTPNISSTALIYFFVFFASIAATAIMEMRWSGVTFTDYWRNEQFWVIGGTSSHLAAVWQGLLKVIFRVDSKFTLTQKDLGDVDDEFAELYIFRWTWLIVPPISIIFVNCLAIAIGITRELAKVVPSWGDLFGKLAFSGWVLVHLYPFAKGLMGRRNRIPPYVWLVLGGMLIALGIGYTTFFTVTGVANGTPSPTDPTVDPGSAYSGGAYANGLYYGP